MNRALVFGAARSGVAAANFLAGRGVLVTLTDGKPEGELPLLASLDSRVTRVLGAHPFELLSDVDSIVLSPGIPKSIPVLAEAASRGIPIISEIELAFRHLQGKVVAITGTNGKSTTTSLIGEILRVAGYDPIVAGNIGEPLISSIDTKPRNYVIELSSFQLETIETFRPDVALLLNVTPDHLDRYDSMNDYAAAKYRIFMNQRPEDFSIVNADDRWTENPPTRAQVWRFSSSQKLDNGAYLQGESMTMTLAGESRSVPRSILRLEGVANAENALASWLAARALGVADIDVEIAFGTFAGLPHRTVLVRELGGVRYVNDSKGTNVDATIKSLEGMPDGKVLLILGGKDKNGDFAKLRDLVSRKARQVMTIGSAAEKISQELAGTAEILNLGDMNRAIDHARANARHGDTVLLSPACASFDQYKNFEERGTHFEELVRALPGGEG